MAKTNTLANCANLHLKVRPEIKLELIRQAHKREMSTSAFAGLTLTRAVEKMQEKSDG